MAETMTFAVETDTGTQLVSVDLSTDLGELTPAEFRLFNQYVVKSGFLPDHARAAAGAAILILLSRQVDVDHDDLLEAVTDG